MTSRELQRHRVSEAEVMGATRNGAATVAYRSMGEVATILGISRQAVHQLERTAMHKLRLGLLAEVRERNPGLAEITLAKARL